MTDLDGGANFGWSQREGTQAFKGADSPAFTPPVAEYLHGTGFSSHSVFSIWISNPMCSAAWMLYYLFHCCNYCIPVFWMLKYYRGLVHRLMFDEPLIWSLLSLYY